MKINLLKKHAKSFYWASFFLDKAVFKKSSTLYNFCRTLDDIVDDVIEAIKSKAHTGRIGDGKIFISDLTEVIRIRTGETGKEAL